VVGCDRHPHLHVRALLAVRAAAPDMPGGGMDF
jgi:hypothetical protein